MSYLESSRGVTSTKTSLTSLPLELREWIGRFATQQSLLALCLTNKDCKEVFTPFLYNSVGITIEATGTYQRDMTDADLDSHIDPLTAEAFRSIAKYRKHIRHVRLSMVIDRGEARQDSPKEATHITYDQELQIRRLQSVLNREEGLRALESCRIEMQYAAYETEEQNRLSPWATERRLGPGLRLSFYKGLTMEDEEPAPLQAYLLSNATPIVIGYLPETSHISLDWLEKLDEIIGTSRHEKSAYRQLICYFDLNRLRSDAVSIETLKPQDVKQITFVGSDARYEGSAKQLSECIKARLESDGLGHLHSCVTFDDWADHPKLAGTLGIVLPVRSSDTVEPVEGVSV